MQVALTGVYGRCGTAILDHLYERPEYDFTLVNRSDRPDDHPYGGYETIIADVSDYDALESALANQDGVIHLAANPYTDTPWPELIEPNVMGMYNALEAARQNEVETFVFGSTNHVMGMYEIENAPTLYELDFGLTIDHTDPVRPDSYYGVTKSFGEDMCRYYVEEFEYPKQVYCLRICSVRHREYDHPYGDAEAAVDDGSIERGSKDYDRKVKRMKAMWQSRRDFTHQLDCCLQDDDVEYGIFHGVSDNDRRWFDIEHARATIGYDPQDNGEEWDGPPS